MRNQIGFIQLCLVLLVLVCGCSSGSKQEDPSNYFLLEAQRQGVGEPAETSMILMVQPFPVSPGIEQRELVYRRSMSRYETDYYERFITDVGSQVAEQTRRWLSQSGCLGQVLPVGTSVDATHLLEGNIAKLHSDFREEANPKALMEVDCYLVDVRTRKPAVVFHGTYNATAKITEAKAESIIAAYNLCLDQILIKLESSLRQADFATTKATP